MQTKHFEKIINEGIRLKRGIKEENAKTRHEIDCSNKRQRRRKITESMKSFVNESMKSNVIKKD